MLPNEAFALACRAYYEEQGLIVDETNGEFAHCPYPEGMGETGYYLLWEHHQQQGLLQSRDVGKCCFFGPDAKKWLLTANYFPDNYFDLWDIYEESLLVRGEAIRKTLLSWPEKKRKARMANAVDAIKKPVKVTFPNGESKVFSSCREVSTELGCDKGSVVRWLKGHRHPSRNYAGYSFCYA